ncbi:MAG: hypothetical protein ACRDJ2_08990 [Actinomycetota bacterium]
MTSHPRQVRVVRHTEETLAASSQHTGQRPRMLLFAIRLPFDLPAPDGAGFSLRRSVDPSEPPWVELTMRRVRIAPAEALLNPYGHGLLAVLGEVEPDLSSGASSQTWILAATVNVLFEDEPGAVAATGGFVTVAFERCLAAVNLLSQTSRLVGQEIDSHPLTKDSLDPEITWFEIDPATGATGQKEVFNCTPVNTTQSSQATTPRQCTAKSPTRSVCALPQKPVPTPIRWSSREAWRFRHKVSAAVVTRPPPS